MMEETKPYRPLGWTTPDESKRLLEHGLSAETCDLWYAERFEATWNEAMNSYDYSETPYYYLSFLKPSVTNWSVDNIRDVPCWSLGQLLELIPARINLSQRFFEYNSKCFWNLEAFVSDGSSFHQKTSQGSHGIFSSVEELRLV